MADFRHASMILFPWQAFTPRGRLKFAIQSYLVIKNPDSKKASKAYMLEALKK
jgi:hypothetical protein